MRGKIVHQIGLPYHWSYVGRVRGGAANDLISFVADPNVHIQESKALTGNIAPGRLGRKRRAAFDGPPKPPRGAKPVARDMPEVGSAHGRQPRQEEWEKE